MVDKKQSDEADGISSELLDQQFLRAATSFEAIMLSQIDIKNKLVDRLNYSIRVGTIILGVMAISILVLLLTLSSQINRISGVFNEMNSNFETVSTLMGQMNKSIGSMETRVALLGDIDNQMASMIHDMDFIATDVVSMQTTVKGISLHVSQVRNNVTNISGAISRMDKEVQLMSFDTQRMSIPARSMRKMFPFP